VSDKLGLSDLTLGAPACYLVTRAAASPAELALFRRIRVTLMGRTTAHGTVHQTAVPGSRDSTRRQRSRVPRQGGAAERPVEPSAERSALLSTAPVLYGPPFRARHERRRQPPIVRHGTLGEYERRRREIEAKLAGHVETFCQRVRDGLAVADIAGKRALLELLVDRVVVTDGAVEIRYALPTGPDGEREPFCRLRSDYRAVGEPVEAVPPRCDPLRETASSFMGVLCLAAALDWIEP
jgi:hypothetical protein